MPNHSAHRGIFVGVDGSAFLEVAVRWAGREAAMRNVTLTIVHVLPIPLEGWQEWAYMPTELGPRQHKKGQPIIDDAIRVAQRRHQGQRSAAAPGFRAAWVRPCFPSAQYERRRLTGHE